jgi:hypothetical protein
MLDDKTMATTTMLVAWPPPPLHTPTRSHRSPNH